MKKDSVAQLVRARDWSWVRDPSLSLNIFGK